jgi:hypothetical protein
VDHLPCDTPQRSATVHNTVTSIEGQSKARHRHSEISMSARKPLFLQEFLSRTDALCCVGLRTCYDAGPHFNTCGPARGMAQSGSASALGAEGRGFESLCPDQNLRGLRAHGKVPPNSYIIRAHSRLRFCTDPSTGLKYIRLAL